MLATAALSGFIIFSSSALFVGAQTIPAGCPGGPAGPRAPGVVCPVIPAGCPGGPPGTLAPGTTCPDTSHSYNPTKTTDTPKYVKNDCSSVGLDQSNCGIIRYLVIFIRALSAIVGITVVIMIIIGGIQYSASADNPQTAQAAQKRIGNAVIALIAYIFTFAFLQWLVPGGIF